MERNIEAYVKVYDNWVDTKLCDKVISELEQVEWHQHTYYNPTTKENKAVNGEKELDITYDSSYADEIQSRIWHAYKRYIDDLDLRWFSSWDGFSQVRFNRYGENTLMSLHCDHIQTVFDGHRKGIPTMTCLSVLNDGYEGGEFIMFDNKEIKLAKGSTIVFPSVFLYPHLVKPVTKGVRYSCVSWAW